MGALRLFLALVVVFDHTRIICLQPLHLGIDGPYTLGFNGGYAVMYFYVISGFLISFVLRHKYEAGRGGVLAFYQSRFIRIFSLYWPMVIIAFLALPSAREAFGNSALLDKFTTLFLFGADWNISFAHYPDPNTMALIGWLGQAWTLGPELTFYLLAPFVLRSPLWTAVLFCLSAAVRAVAVAHCGFSNLWTYHFFPSTLLFFLLGHLAAASSERLGSLKRPVTGLFLTAVCFLALNFPTPAPWDSLRFWLSVACFAFGLPGVFAWTKDNKVLNKLGELSFPVYLTHLLLIHFIMVVHYDKWVAHRGGHLSSQLIMASMMALALAVSAVIHQWVETPVASLMRKGCARIGRRPS